MRRPPLTGLHRSGRCGPSGRWAMTESGLIKTRFSAERGLLSISAVCDELKISRSTFYDWRTKGRAPKCVKLPNGCLRVRRADLDRWLTEHEG